jgi:hypothetical protein
MTLSNPKTYNERNTQVTVKSIKDGTSLRHLYKEINTNKDMYIKLPKHQISL